VGKWAGSKVKWGKGTKWSKGSKGVCGEKWQAWQVCLAGNNMLCGGTVSREVCRCCSVCRAQKEQVRTHQMVFAPEGRTGKANRKAARSQNEPGAAAW